MRSDGGAVTSGEAARNTASSLLPFFGTRLRRQNFNLAPTQYRQLRRLPRSNNRPPPNTPPPSPHPREATTAHAVTTSNTSLDLTSTKRSSDTKPLTTYGMFRAHFSALHASFFLKYISSFFIDFFEKSGILRMRALPATYVEGFHDLEAVKKMKYQPLGRTGMDVSKLSFGKVVSESFNQMQKC